jgi:hypothetical protein
MKEGKKIIYIAGPLFNDMEKQRNLELDEELRKKVQWEVPRKSNGWAYGFGRANVWYASEEDSRLQDYLTRLVKQIDEYDGENWIDKYAE